MHWRFSLANLCFLHLGVKKDNSHVLMRLRFEVLFAGQWWPAKGISKFSIYEPFFAGQRCGDPDSRSAQVLAF